MTASNTFLVLFSDLNHFNPLLTVLTVLAKLPAAFLTASKIETALKTAMTERIGVTGFGIKKKKFLQKLPRRNF